MQEAVSNLVGRVFNPSVIRDIPAKYGRVGKLVGRSNVVLKPFHL